MKWKKTFLIVSGVVLVVIIGAITYFVWPKKEAKTENKQQTNSKEEIQRLQKQLSSLKQKINNLSDNTKKTQLESKLTNTESRASNLSNQKSVQKSTIKKLEEEIEEIKKELEGDKPDKPKDNPPEPDPQPENNGWKYIATKINDNTYKYHITLGGTQLSFRDFISFSKNKKNAFFKAFQGALKDANSKFPAYFWKCPPVSKNTLDKPFEFVVIKSEDLNNTTQNHKPFEEYLVEPFLSGKYVVSFPNQGKDAILIVPSREFGKDPNKHNDYKNLSQFTKNASLAQQQELWKEVANKLMEELEKNADAPRWLNTHGLGVHYLHVRIDEKPKYYGDYEEYKKQK